MTDHREFIGYVDPNSLNVGMECPAKSRCATIATGGTVWVIDFEEQEGECRCGHRWSFGIQRN
jgi:hypothetical protein